MQGLRGHYIGLHQESTSKRTAAYAAFVCFQKASDEMEPRGRFLIADGKRILARLPPKLLKKLYERQVRISVSNLDLPNGTPGVLKGVFKRLVEKLIAPKFDMELEMIYGCDGTSDGRLMAVEVRRVRSYAKLLLKLIDNHVIVGAVPRVSHQPAPNHRGPSLVL